MSGSADALDAVPCGVLSTAPDGTITAVNAELLDWTGYAREQLVGARRFTDLLTTGGRIYHETHFGPLLHATGDAREVALDIVAADGSRVPALVNARLQRDGAGRPLAVHVALFGVAVRRDYERELLRAKADAEAAAARSRLLVRTLQETLIPPAAPTVEGLDIAAAYRPAGTGDEVGGDFYDVFEIGGGHWIAVVGDVTGKGIEAAMVTALARYTIRAAAMRTRDPRRILGTLNDVLRGDETTRLCTVALVLLARTGDGWRVTTCHGGHPLALVVRPGAEVAELGRPGTLLGFTGDPRLRVVTSHLADGDAIVLYTDGVTEGRRGRELYGEERTQRAVRRYAGSANGLTYGLLDDVVRFQDDVTSDDIVIVSLQARAG